MKTINSHKLYYLLLIVTIIFLIIYYLSGSYIEAINFSGHKARGIYGCDNYIGEAIKFKNNTFEFKTTLSPLNFDDIVFHDVSVHTDQGRYRNINPVYYKIKKNELKEINRALKDYLSNYNLNFINPRDHLKIGFNGKVNRNRLNQYISTDSISLFFEDTLIYGYDYLNKSKHPHHLSSIDTIPKYLLDSLHKIHRNKDYKGQYGCGFMNKNNFNIDTTLNLKKDTIFFVNCFYHLPATNDTIFVDTVYYIVNQNQLNKWNKAIKNISNINYSKFGVAFEDIILKDNNNQYYVTKKVDLYYGADKL